MVQVTCTIIQLQTLLVMTSANGEALVALQPYTLGYIDSSNELLVCMADIPWAVPFI